MADQKPTGQVCGSDNFSKHRGALLLTFGILGITTIMPCWPVMSVIAWMCATKDLRKIRSGRMDPTGKTMTAVALVLGIIGTVFFMLIVLLICLVHIHENFFRHPN